MLMDVTLSLHPFSLSVIFTLLNLTRRNSMIFDYKEGVKKREQLSHEQLKLLSEFVSNFKTSFLEWYSVVDKTQVDWMISQFLLDCGYTCKQKDFNLCFNIPTGLTDEYLNEVSIIVKQYGASFVIGKYTQEISLCRLRGETNEN